MAGHKTPIFTDIILDDIHTAVDGLEALLAQFGFDGSALNGIDLGHHEVHEGNAFACHLVDLTFAKDGEVGVIFTTPAGNKRLHMVPLISVTDKSTFDILEAPTIDAGNYPAQFATPINRNRNSANPSIVWSVRAAPVANQVGIILDGNTTPITADGLTVHTEVMGGAKNKSPGEGVRDTAEYILKANTTYYFRIVGDGTGTGALGLSMELTWYERNTIL